MAEKPGKHYEIRRKRHIYYYMCAGEKYYELRKKSKKTKLKHYCNVFCNGVLSIINTRRKNNVRIPSTGRHLKTIKPNRQNKGNRGK